MMTKAKWIRIGKWFVGSITAICCLISLLLYVFKDEICGYVIEHVNGYLKTEVKVAEVDLTFWATFPNLSVDFNGVYIRDAFKKPSKNDTLFSSNQIRLKFNPWDIWNENYNLKSIDISEGQLHLKVRKNGEVNYDIFKPSNKKKSDFQLMLQGLTIEQVALSYDNAISNQHYRSEINELLLKGEFNQDEFDMEVASDFYVKALRSGKLTLLSNQVAACNFTMHINNKSSTYLLPASTISIAGLPFIVQGEINRDSLDFKLKADELSFEDAVNKLRVAGINQISQFQGKGKVRFDLNVNGKNKTDAPVSMECHFGVTNGSLLDPIKKLRISNIQLQGTYEKKVGRQEKLSFQQFRLNTPAGPFQGKLDITEFSNPHYKGQARGNLNMGFVHDLFSLPYIHKISGYLGLDTEFDVVQHSSLSNNTVEIRRCQGEVHLKGIDTQLKNDKRMFRKIKGKLYLRNDEAGMEGVSLEVGSTDLALDGVFKNIVPYVQNKGDIVAEVAVNSKNIKVEDLGGSTKQEKIDQPKDYVLPNDIDARVDLDVRSLSYDKHRLNHVGSQLTMKGRTITFQNLRARNADADLVGSMTVEEQNPEKFYLSTDVASQNIHFKKLFKEWNNFDQDVITYEHISGNAEANVHFEAPFDFETGVISNDIKAQVYMKVVNGKLSNVEALQSIVQSLDTRMAKAVLGKENIKRLSSKLKQLDFNTLENTFEINNGVLEIPEMLVSSSVLDMVVSGKHTFDNKVDYRFTFRFRDLKERKQTEFGEEIDDGTGLKVYMRMTGDLDNPTISWDKEAMKQDAKERREQEKETIKSMLKTEFGLFKNDTTVKRYNSQNGNKETISIDLDPAQPAQKPEEKKKPSKVKNKLEQWKSESAKDKQENIDFP